MMKTTDVIIIGAGAAGLMCAIEAGKRGRQVLVIEHSNKVGKKILMSGGGRCNFTNYHVSADQFISHNPHFCKSALHRFTPRDFIALVDKYKIPYHEKKLGQLFCNNKAKDIVNMLLSECKQYQVDIRVNTHVDHITQSDTKGFMLKTSAGKFQCQSLVIATGGLSIPTMGASAFGYQIAEQFHLPVYPTRAALVPLTLHIKDKDRFSSLSGISVLSNVSVPHQSFIENILFTHRGLSGPAILQISSYWQPGECITINCLPEVDVQTLLSSEKFAEKTLKTVLSYHLSKNVVAKLIPDELNATVVKSLTPKQKKVIGELIHRFTIQPNGTEGYRTAEVTLGGVNCNALSSKTMEVNSVPGLYFIGEVLDVTGWLGGYNFQWAWSSGWAAGQVV